MSGQFRSTFLLYIALVLGQIVFCLVVFFMLTQPDRPFLREGSDYPFLALFAVFLEAGAAWYVNQLRIQSTQSLQTNFTGKLLHYRTTILLRVAMVEVGNLFCLILALLENSLTPLLYFCVGMLVFLYFKPNINEVTTLYQLNEEERQELEKQLRSR